MNRAHTWVALSAGLLTTAAFAGCSGLDDRKVTRGADTPTAGASDGDGGSDSGSVGGDAPGGGAPDGRGGDGSPSPVGGDSSFGGAPLEPDAPPEVIQVDPADGSADVAPVSNVSLLFSKDLAPETVTNEQIQVLDGERAVAGALAYENASVTFEPDARLSLLATYEVKVSTGVRGASGDPLKEAFASKFTVRDGSWGRQSSVTVDPANAGEHASGIDAEGNVLVVYTVPLDSTIPGGPKTVAARWIPVARTIREEVLLEDNGTPCRGVKVAVDAQGNAFALWQSEDAGGIPVMRGRRYVDGSWERSAQNLVPEGAAALIENATSSAVAIGAGQVVAAWVRSYHQGSTPYSVFEYTSTSLDGAWPKPMSTSAVINSSPASEYYDGAQAAVDAKGNAITTFVWHSSTNLNKGVYFALRAADKPWGNATKIPSSNVQAPGQGGPALVSDGDGAMAVWLDFTNSQYRLFASRYTRARQFAAPVEIGDPRLTGTAALSSRGGLATNGDSYWVTWTQQLGDAQNVYVKRYDVATSTWDAEPRVVSDGFARAGTSTIGVDAHGNAIVTYDQGAPKNSVLVMFTRHVAGSVRWSDPTSLTDANTYFEWPLLSVASNGVASVLFSSRANESLPGSKNTSGSFRIFK
jgi:Bacterial Ig-like domain